MRSVVVSGFLVLAACHAKDDRSAWSELFDAPACDTKPMGLPSTWADVKVNSPSGSLHLPSTFRAAGTSGGNWQGADASEFTYTIVSEPSSGFSGHSALLSRLHNPSYALETICRLTVQGHPAVVTRFRHVDVSKRDTVFGLTATVAVGPKQLAEVLALTPTSQMRDSLFGTVGSLQWR